MNLRSIDCIATRLWFDRRVPTRCADPPARPPPRPARAPPAGAARCRGVCAAGPCMGAARSAAPRPTRLMPPPCHAQLCVQRDGGLRAGGGHHLLQPDRPAGDPSVLVWVIRSFRLVGSRGSGWRHLPQPRRPARRRPSSCPTLAAPWRLRRCPCLPPSTQQPQSIAALHPPTHSPLPNVPTRPLRLQDEYRNEPGTVIAADYYGASRLLPLSGTLRRLPPAAARLRAAGEPAGGWVLWVPCAGAPACLHPAQPSRRLTALLRAPHNLCSARRPPSQTRRSSGARRPTWPSASPPSGTPRWAAGGRAVAAGRRAAWGCWGC